MEEKINERKIEFSKFVSEMRKKTRISECLCPRKIECSEKIIKAHSIQNNRILNKISVDGKIMQFDATDAIFTNDLSKVGRKAATTFTGFCGFHDNELFKSIELKDYESDNKEQEFFFAYRCLARELHIKKQSKKLFTELMSRSPNNPNFKWMQEGTINAIKELTNLNYRFHQDTMNKRFELIETKKIELKKQYSIAVCSIFSPEYDLKGNKVNSLEDFSKPTKKLFLTIFPQNGSTIVLMSCIKEDNSLLEFLDEQLLALQENEIIDKLNLLIAMYCENFAYSPTKWDHMPKNEREKFVSKFYDSIDPKNPQDWMEKPKFNLFI